MGGVERQRALAIVDRISETAELAKLLAALHQNVGVVRLERECLAVARQRLGIAAEGCQIVPGLECIGIVGSIARLCR
jgi:hypothetical protein